MKTACLRGLGSGRGSDRLCDLLSSDAKTALGSYPFCSVMLLLLNRRFSVFLAVMVNLLNRPPPRKPKNLMTMVARDCMEMMRDHVSSGEVSREEG